MCTNIPESESDTLIVKRVIWHDLTDKVNHVIA